MDLLNGYGSSSSSDNDDNEEYQGIRKTEQQKKPETQRKQPSSRRSTNFEKKVLSLSSVLPTHIYSQLTNNNTNNESDDDDDDDDDKKPKPVKVTKNAGANLLSDLSSLPPARHAAAAPPSKSPANNKSTTELGQAFVTETVVVETVEKNSSQEVRNVHSEAPTATATTTSKLSPPPKPASSRFVRRPLPRPTDPFASSSTTPQMNVPHSVTTTTATTNRKRSHREMERALRKGDWTALEGRQDVQQLEPSVSSYNQQQQQQQPYVHTHGLHTTGIGEVGARGKAKNQIHHLLASATQLERDKIQRASVGMTSAKEGRSQAKKKYGW